MVNESPLHAAGGTSAKRGPILSKDIDAWVSLTTRAPPKKDGTQEQLISDQQIGIARESARLSARESLENHRKLRKMMETMAVLERPAFRRKF
jgi:hypothetical protein